MWRSKKFIVIAVLAVVMLVGGIGGAVLAADDGDDSQPETRWETLWDKVGEIYEQKTGVALDQEALKDAFAQAQSEIGAEALDSYLQNLVDQGTITQEEADQFKAWLQAKPDMEPFRQQLREWQQAKPEIPPELEEWQQARPDVSIRFGFRSHGRFLGIGGFHGMGGLCIPAE
jgi:hypothetical protein